MGKSEKLSVQAFIGVSRRQGMPIQNDNTVVQVPFYKLEVRICVFVSLTIDTPYNFFLDGCKNYVKITLFGSFYC